MTVPLHSSQSYRPRPFLQEDEDEDEDEEEEEEEGELKGGGEKGEEREEGE